MKKLTELPRPSLLAFSAILPLFLLLGGCSDSDSSNGEEAGSREESNSQVAVQKKPTTRGGAVENIDSDERRQAIDLQTVAGPVQKENMLYAADVRSAFEQQNFDWLEQEAESLRSSEELTRDGMWKIHRFYEGLAKRFGDNKNELMHDQERIENWRKAKPDSITAKTAEGHLYIDIAWFIRGGGYSHTVTEEQWEGFHAFLQRAGQLMTPLVTGGLEDPFSGEVMLHVALGTGPSREEYDALMKVLKDRHPKYWHYDIRRAWSLEERWHGEEGDWEEYATWAADREDGLGDEVYTRIAISRMDAYGNVFRDTAMRWPRAKKGVETLLEKYPDSLFIKSAATRLAVLGNDRDMAKKLYEELGPQFVEDAWLNKEQFVHFRTWARTGRW
jgi:hypothetical protein